MMNPPIQPEASTGKDAAGGLMATLGALGGPIASIGGALLGGIFGSRAAKKRNRMQMQLAREQMQFQERMSNTAYQRAAKDLEAAGLNRILALGKPATSPGGAMAQLLDPGAAAANAATTALGVRRQAQEIRNLKAQERLSDAQAVSARAQAHVYQSQEGLLGAQTQESLERMFNIVQQRKGIVADAEIRNLQIPGVATEEEFYSWINSKEAEVYFKGLTTMGPLILQGLKAWLTVNRNRRN